MSNFIEVISFIALAIMGCVLAFFIAVCVWKAIDSSNPCSQFSQSGACESGRL